MENHSTDSPGGKTFLYALLNRTSITWNTLLSVNFQITKEAVDCDSFETVREFPSCQLEAVWTNKESKPSQLIHTMTLKGTTEPSYFSIVLDSDSTPSVSIGGEFAQ